MTVPVEIEAVDGADGPVSADVEVLSRRVQLSVGKVLEGILHPEDGFSGRQGGRREGQSQNGGGRGGSDGKSHGSCSSSRMGCTRGHRPSRAAAGTFRRGRRTDSLQGDRMRVRCRL